MVPLLRLDDDVQPRSCRVRKLECSAMLPVPGDESNVQTAPRNVAECGLSTGAEDAGRDGPGQLCVTTGRGARVSSRRRAPSARLTSVEPTSAGQVGGTALATLSGAWIQPG